MVDDLETELEDAITLTFPSPNRGILPEVILNHESRTFKVHPRRVKKTLISELKRKKKTQVKNEKYILPWGV